MPDTNTRLALLTPHGVDQSHVATLVPALAAACRAGDVAAVILRLAPGDERGLTALLKQVVPAAQATGAAVVVAVPGIIDDLVGVAARGGADGVHADRAGEAGLHALRTGLRDGRVLGAGGVTESRHEAMAAGEAGVDYVMFGGLYPDGVAPDADLVRERAEWWAEIFETPCIAVAARAGEVVGLVGTRAEFVGLEAALWIDDPAQVGRAQALLDAGDPAA